MAGYIGEADILIGADASNLAKDVQRQASANLKAAGSQLGRELSDSVAKAASAASAKIPQSIIRPLKQVPAAAQQVGAAIQKSLTTAVAAASSQITKLGANARIAFSSVIASAKSLAGQMGIFSNASSKAFALAKRGLQDLSAGWKSSTSGLSSFTGKLGSMGTIARSATALVASTLKTAIPAAGRLAFKALTASANAAWGLLKTGSSKAWAALKSGAEKAAKSAGDALKNGLGAAAKGAAAVIAVGVGAILGKGFSRLNSLNQAEARLTGLGLAGKQLESVMKSADDAVGGTAFSMADAANAAGLLSSAGVQAGGQMDDAMKALVATAAGAGAEISDITPIFAKIAASGKVSGETMQQMMERGINASGALQKSLGKTADEITAMVSSGQIDMATFTTAINGDLGMLAASMGGTLTGMISNVGSAFGRIGAAVQEPIFNGLLVAMPSVLDFIKRLTTAVQEFMAPMQESLTPLAENFAKILDGISFDSAGIGSFVDSLGALLPILGAVVGVSGGLLSSLPVIGPLFAGLSGPVGLVAGALAALTMVDPTSLANGFTNIVSSLQSSLPGMMTSVIGVIETGLSNLIQNLPTMLGGLTDILLTLLSTITAALPTVIPMLVGAIGQMIPALLQSLLQAIPLILNGAMQLFGGLVTGLVQALPLLVSTLVGAIPELIQTLVDAIPMILDGALQMFMGILEALVEAIPLIITALVEAIPLIISALLDAIPKILEAAIQLFLGIVTGLLNALPTIIKALIEAIPQILTAIIEAIPQMIEASISMFLGLITGLLEAIPAIITAVIEMIPVIIDALIGAIPQIIDAGIQLFESLLDPEVIQDVLGKFWDAITTKVLPGIWDAITGQGDKAKESGKTIGDNASAGLASTSGSFSTASTTLASTANTTMGSYSGAMSATGAQLGTSASTGLTSASTSVNAAATGLGTGASSALGAQSGAMTTAASGLGASAVTGLSAQTSAATAAASDLANAATIDVATQVEKATTAGKAIAAAFTSGITTGGPAATTAAIGLANLVKTSVSKTQGFVEVGVALTGGISLGITQGTPAVSSAMNALVGSTQRSMIAGVVGVVGSSFRQLWTAQVFPTLSLIVAGVTSATTRIRSVWAATAANLRSTFSSQIAPMLAAFSNLVRTGPPNAFAAAAAAIITAWDSIRAAAARPVRFVVDTVMNGLIGAMNQIPGVNVPKLSLPAGFAHGGILPGMSSMRNGDDQLIQARRGEGVMVSEALRSPADRSAFLAANAAGRKGVGFSSLLQGFARGGLVNPLPKGSYSVSQPFSGAHNGIDLAAAMGTKVFAAAKGIVQLAQSVPMGGNEIYVQHDGIATRYSHLGAFAVKAGDQVRKNQTIGRVGSTGMSTGPHLHYMVHQPNDGGSGRGYQNILDPSPFLGTYGTEVDGFMDVLSGVASAASARFAANFPLTNMFSQATAGILKQGIAGALASAKGSLGTDSSDGAEGRTGAIIPKLYDAGGVLGKGFTLAQNKSGKPEAILTNAQWAMISQLASSLVAGSLGSSPIGVEIAEGLARGIIGGQGVVGNATSGLASAVLDTMRSDLEIHSPSKAMEKIGKQIGAGLVKGVSGTSAEVKSATDELTATIKEQFNSLVSERSTLQSKLTDLWAKAREIDWTKNWDAAMKKAVKLNAQIVDVNKQIAAINNAVGSSGTARRDSLVKFIKDQTVKLHSLARQREAVVAKLQAAQDVLKDRTGVRDDWVQSISASIVDQGSVAGSTTSSGMIRTLTKQIAASKSFNTAITNLRKMGLDDTTLEQLTQDFASTGSSKAAERLAAGGSAAVKELAELQKQLAEQANKVATGTGSMLYQSGIDIAKGLAKGLESEQAALDKAAKRIADTITETIKKTLKIKSPSRVMDELGGFAVDGFVAPMENRLGEVIAASQRLAMAPADAVRAGIGSLDGAALSAAVAPTPTATRSEARIVFEAGAIVVQGSDDPARTAQEVVDRIAELTGLGGL